MLISVGWGPEEDLTLASGRTSFEQERRLSSRSTSRAFTTPARVFVLEALAPRISIHNT